jgi:hypothetical protein
MEVVITDELEKEVMELNKRGWYATNISRAKGLSLFQIYEIYKKRQIKKVSFGAVFNVRGFREQIILSGILGDGYIKKNGKGYYYTECHALDEADYCEWKFRALGDLCEGHRLYAKNANNKYSDAVEFTTITTTSLKKYKEMPKEEVIDRLNLVGVVLFILDDGWIRRDTNQFCISGGELTKEQLELFCLRCEYLGLENVHIVGVKRYDIAIPKENNALIIKTAFRIFLRDKATLRKKFFFMFEKEDFEDFGEETPKQLEDSKDNK